MLAAELPKALRDRLARDERLIGLLDKYNGSPAVFYGAVPERAGLPCISIGPSSSEEKRDTKLTLGRLVTRPITVIGKQNGDEFAVDQIAERVSDLLHHGNLSVTGYDTIEVRVVDGPRSVDLADAYGRALSVRVWLQEARS